MCVSAGHVRSPIVPAGEAVMNITEGQTEEDVAEQCMGSDCRLSDGELVFTFHPGGPGRPGLPCGPEGPCRK